MDNTKILEEKYGKPVSEWGVLDFNTIGLNSELSELMTVETYTTNANDESLPEATRNIFTSYIIVDKFTSAVTRASKMFQTVEENDSVDEKIKTLLMDDFKNGEDDYIKANGLWLLLTIETHLGENEKLNLDQYEDDAMRILDSLIEDIEFIGPKTFLTFTEQYIDLIIGIAASYMSIYGVDLIDKYFEERMNDLLNNFNDFKTELLSTLFENEDFMNSVMGELGDMDPETFEKLMSQLTDSDDEDDTKIRIVEDDEI